MNGYDTRINGIYKFMEEMDPVQSLTELKRANELVPISLGELELLVKEYEEKRTIITNRAIAEFLQNPDVSTSHKEAFKKYFDIK